MSRSLDKWLATGPNYIPHYSHTQEILGTAIFVTVVVVVVVTFIIIIQYRRRR